MPLTLNDLNTYCLLDGDFTTPRLVNVPIKSYVWPNNDIATYMVKEDYVVASANYVGIKPGSKHPTKALYLISNSEPTQIELGMCRYTLTWMVLPGYDDTGKKTSYVHTDYESYNMQVPGLDSGEGTDNPFNYTTGYTYNKAAGTLTITVGSAHGLAAGKTVYIGCEVSDPINNNIYYPYVVRQVISSTTYSITVSTITNINTVVPVKFCLLPYQQAPYTKTVTSMVIKDYHIVGGNITSYNDIQPIEEFKILDNTTNAKTETITVATNPTYDEYLTMVNNQQWLPVECIIGRFQDSEFYERKTRYVRAQV